MMMIRSLSLAALGVLLSGSVAFGAPAAAARTVTIQGSDNLKYSVTHIDAKPGERLHLVLKSTGTIPKNVMAHNVVVLKKGADPAAFANASATARDTGYIPAAFKTQILASTPLAGPGETVDVTFTVPKAPGNYDYLCSFPGHFIAGMKGVLAVK
jgi:azurin